jgi:Ca2+-binding EF-hand superfamily protein
MMNGIGGAAAAWSNTLFSRLDTKNQGYIEASDLQAAFGSSDADGASKLFAKLDGDQDGKVTKSELSTAIDKLAQQLDSDFNQSRAAKGGPPPGGGHGGGPGGPPPAEDSSSTSTTSAAADTNGDGTVSAEEQAAYTAAQANAGTATASTDTGLSKEELTEKLNGVDSTDGRRAQMLSKLIDNFDQADSNGDGKLTRKEGHDFMKQQREAEQASRSQGTNDSAAVTKSLELLKAYFDKQESSSTVETTA